MSVLAVHPLKEIDVTGALVYGEILYINQRYVYADELENDQIPQAFFHKLEKAVDEFDPEHDYMLIAGDHLQMVALAALLANRWGQFKTLRYDRKAGGYLVVEIVTAFMEF